MSPIVWTPAATRDLQRQHQFLTSLDPEVANRAIQAIVKVGGSLSQNPKRGRVIDEGNGLRKLPVRFGKSGFVLHYAIIFDEVVILRVFHGRENRPR